MNALESHQLCDELWKLLLTFHNFDDIAGVWGFVGIVFAVGQVLFCELLVNWNFENFNFPLDVSERDWRHLDLGADCSNLARVEADLFGLKWPAWCEDGCRRLRPEGTLVDVPGLTFLWHLLVHALHGDCCQIAIGVAFCQWPDLHVLIVSDQCKVIPQHMLHFPAPFIRFGKADVQFQTEAASEVRVDFPERQNWWMNLMDMI